MSSPTKPLTSTSLLAAVESTIHDALLKQGVFQNPSLCFHGCDLDFSIRLTLYSRGEEDIVVRGHHADQVPADAPKTKITVEGKHSAGRKSKTEGATVPDYKPVAADLDYLGLGHIKE